MLKKRTVWSIAEKNLVIEKKLDRVLQYLSLSDLYFLSGGVAGIEFRNINLVFKQNHVILPELKHDALEGLLFNWQE